HSLHSSRLQRCLLSPGAAGDQRRPGAYREPGTGAGGVRGCPQRCHAAGVPAVRLASDHHSAVRRPRHDRPPGTPSMVHGWWRHSRAAGVVDSVRLCVGDGPCPRHPRRDLPPRSTGDAAAGDVATAADRPWLLPVDPGPLWQRQPHRRGRFRLPDGLQRRRLRRRALVPSTWRRGCGAGAAGRQRGLPAHRLAADAVDVRWRPTEDPTARRQFRAGEALDALCPVLLPSAGRVDGAGGGRGAGGAGSNGALAGREVVTGGV
ncbi:uncharacterized protein METZ01_LOCUS440181, partial [marine metagenome]